MSDERSSITAIEKGTYHNIPTILVDGALGSSWVGGMHRIVLGEFVFNTAEGAEMPASRPVLNLAITTDALPYLIEYLQNLSTVSDAK
jgi:hypothetical protein